MSREQEIRAAALSLKIEREAFQVRIEALNGSADQAEVLALLADLQEAVARARNEIGGLLGLTPASFRLVDEEVARLRRDIGGDLSEEDLLRSKIGEIVAGLRASRSDEGGEA